MNQNTPSLSIPGDCEMVSMLLTQKIYNAGYQVIRSFDLQRAREMQPSYVCAHHGTTDCDCQMIVLLIYLQTGKPQTLILHGRDGTSSLSWGNDLSAQDEQIMLTIFKDVFTQNNNKTMK